MRPFDTSGPKSSHIKKGSDSFDEKAFGKAWRTEKFGSPDGYVTPAARTPKEFIAVEGLRAAVEALEARVVEKRGKKHKEAVVTKRFNI